MSDELPDQPQPDAVEPAEQPKPKHRPKKPAKNAPPGIQERQIAMNGDRYTVSCGYIIDGERRKPLVIDLGTDEQVARIRRGIIKAEWKKAKVEGHDVWPASVLLRLGEQGVIGQTAAVNNAKRAAKGDLVALMKTPISTSPNATYELSKFKDDMGNVRPEAFGDYAFALLRGDVLDADGETKIRKALKHLVGSEPLTAFRMTLELWKLLQELKGEDKSQVTVNVNGVSAMDVSEQRKITLAEIVGEAFEEPDRDIRSE